MPQSGQVACRSLQSGRWAAYYHRRLQEIYRHLVGPGRRVLDIGCGTGDLLASLRPSVGVGVDHSGEIIRQATSKHPDLHFVQADAHAIPVRDAFDVIIMSDLVNEVWDVQTVLEEAGRLAGPRTRLILNFYSKVWELPLAAAAHLRLATPTLGGNWLTPEDLRNLLHLTSFEVLRTWQEILWPVGTPVLAELFNRFLVKLWPVRLAGLTNVMVARPLPRPEWDRPEPAVSVIIPARNEAGTIPEIFHRTPRMGRSTELVFVEGLSTDNTYETIRTSMEAHPEWKCQLIKQQGMGKGDAVRLGFSRANGDILMILDADLSVAPEDLPRFYHALRFGKCEFANGVRLVYPMENKAMQFANLVGNKLFGLLFSWLLGQFVKDTLCGTKALWRRDYEVIQSDRAYFGDFDPFGDFELLLGAARLNLKIMDIPIRYRKRRYGQTNIQRWMHGWLLLRMSIIAARRLKFV